MKSEDHLFIQYIRQETKTLVSELNCNQEQWYSYGMGYFSLVSVITTMIGRFILNGWENWYQHNAW